MKKNNTNMKPEVLVAASDAVFRFQLPTRKAINYVTSTVLGISRNQARKAIEQTVIEYKIPA